MVVHLIRTRVVAFVCRDSKATIAGVPSRNVKMVVNFNLKPVRAFAPTDFLGKNANVGRRAVATVEATTRANANVCALKAGLAQHVVAVSKNARIMAYSMSQIVAVDASLDSSAPCANVLKRHATMAEYLTLKTVGVHV